MRTESIPQLSHRLSFRDWLGRLGVRWAIGRKRYRVEPGLYRLGSPTAESPVLVTANYKLTFDVVRSALPGVAAWILVLDTDGVNVWCAAGKGTFGTDELVRRIEEAGLSEVVTHRKLVVPQLGATGVAAREVKRRTGFLVKWGPVRARDIDPFLAARMQATEAMRRVTFPLRDRLALVGVEVAVALKWVVLLLAALMLLAGDESVLARLGEALSRGAPILAGLLTGTVLVPALLPWLPGRAFSLKGAFLGAVVVGATLFALADSYSTAGRVQAFLLGTAAASFFAMQFTGASTYTSPSGVEWEMRRALPFQVGAAVAAGGIGIWRAFLG